MQRANNFYAFKSPSMDCKSAWHSFAPASLLMIIWRWLTSVRSRGDCLHFFGCCLLHASLANTNTNKNDKSRRLHGAQEQRGLHAPMARDFVQAKSAAFAGWSGCWRPPMPKTAGFVVLLLFLLFIGTCFCFDCCCFYCFFFCFW